MTSYAERTYNLQEAKFDPATQQSDIKNSVTSIHSYIYSSKSVIIMHYAYAAMVSNSLCGLPAARSSLQPQ